MKTGPTWDRGTIRRHFAGVHRARAYVQHRRRRVVVATVVTLGLLAAPTAVLDPDRPNTEAGIVGSPAPDPNTTWTLDEPPPPVEDRPVRPASRHLRPTPAPATPTASPTPLRAPAHVQAAAHTTTPTAGSSHAAPPPPRAAVGRHPHRPPTPRAERPRLPRTCLTRPEHPARADTVSGHVPLVWPGHRPPRR